jgi:hypothetical protein
VNPTAPRHRRRRPTSLFAVPLAVAALALAVFSLTGTASAASAASFGNGPATGLVLCPISANTATVVRPCRPCPIFLDALVVRPCEPPCPFDLDKTATVAYPCPLPYPIHREPSR